MRRDQVLDALLILLGQAVAHTEKLEGQVQDLKLALGYDKVSNVQAAFGVSEALAKLPIVLAQGKPKTKEQLHAALYFEQPDNSAADLKVIDTLICKVRKHIGTHNVKIETRWGSGYQIVAGLEVVRSAIEFAEPHGEAAAARLRKIERERERQRLIRAARGCKDRKSYEEQSLSRQRPWEALGVSRDTWERRRAAGRLATNDNALAAAANRVTA